jgi:S-adenosylmethionine:tRNA ribosyltransferase-isomerase
MPSPVIPTNLFDYRLPAELVAQMPTPRRDGSRLLVVDRRAHTVEHRMFDAFPDFLRAGDTLFRNNASVLPARLVGRRSTGGRFECLLLKKDEAQEGPGETWQCLVRPGRRLPVGAKFQAAADALSGTVASLLGDGSVLVHFEVPAGGSVVDAANRAGEIPLPPYIERGDGSRREEDRLRYQTVYADPCRQVAVAAPTAGLHFTPELLDRIQAKGVRTADLTLHVGLGTFRPIATETVEIHPIHRESYEIPVDTQRALFPPLTGRRIAVGTTTVRSIEDFLSGHGAAEDTPHRGEAALFLYPPRAFRGVDALLTNFHQPRSTLLCLVSSFLTPGSTEGIAWLKEIYAEAIAAHYRFFSYGDAMLIL